MNRRLEEKINELIISMEKIKLAEYVELLNNPKKLLWVNFVAGIARGLGTAIGLTLLFALLLYILQKLVLLNLPLLSDFIATLIHMVQNSSRFPKY